MYSPTDVIGQHIHLVKFDVTSSDGSGNGWNYEDGALGADEIRERIAANNRYQRLHGGTQILRPKNNPMFAHPSATLSESMRERGVCPNSLDPNAWEKAPWCGAETMISRWWADPLLNAPGGHPGTNDRTLRTVFTHDHFGPSSHQHHGLYAALVIEPSDSRWEFLDGHPMGGASANNKPVVMPGHIDGGPTSYAANVIVPRAGHGNACVDATGRVTCSRVAATSIDPSRSAREFGLAFADYAIVYTAANRPVNPPNRIETGLQLATAAAPLPGPEGISTKDPGTQLINYRNEPFPFRLGAFKGATFAQPHDSMGNVEPNFDIANVFSSTAHTGEVAVPSLLAPDDATVRGSGDPATPILRAYDGDKVQLRLIQGAQEENHIFSMHGAKWLSQPNSANSGYVNAQPIGISEHFEFNVKFDASTPGTERIDHLYQATASDNLWDGQWGLLRTFGTNVDESRAKLHRFHPERRTAASASLPICPEGNLDANGFETRAAGRAVPMVDYVVTAWPVAVLAAKLRETLPAAAVERLLPGGALSYNARLGIADPDAVIFVEAETMTALQSGRKQSIEPLVLRAPAGACIRVVLKNRLRRISRDLVGTASWPATWSYNLVSPIMPTFNFNQFASSTRVSLHPQLVAVNTFAEDGAHIGVNPYSSVPPCSATDCNAAQKTYHWYAGDFTYVNGRRKFTPIEFGAAVLRDASDVIKGSSHGAVGALVIEPQGSRSGDRTAGCGPDTSATDRTDASATICSADGKPLFREFVLLYQDDVSAMRFGQALPNLRGGDDVEDSGQKAFNYRTEPLWARQGVSGADELEETAGYDYHTMLSSTARVAGCATALCDPVTPFFRARAGTPVRFRVLHPGGHPRMHTFALYGHDWINSPFACGDPAHPDGGAIGPCDSTKMGWNMYAPTRFGATGGIGPLRDINVLVDGAGGAFARPGDYLYRTQESFTFDGGEWGIFCVYDDTDPKRCEPARRAAIVAARAAPR